MRESFILSPNLPQNRVSLVLVSCRIKEITDELARLGIKYIDPGCLSGISGSERFHADMNICHIGNNKLFCAQNSSVHGSELQNAGFELIHTDTPVTARKPGLNICMIGKNVLCDTKTADPKLISVLKSEGKTILHTNQMYARCSTAIAAENAVMTSDPSIYELCRKNGIDVLRIAPGYITLDGYAYGFIGGCCGLISKDTLAFSGSITRHPDCENIRSFAGNYGIKTISLSDAPLCDVGGILPVKEFSVE